jgi:hypothetical protein
MVKRAVAKTSRAAKAGGKPARKSARKAAPKAAKPGGATTVDVFNVLRPGKTYKRNAEKYAAARKAHLAFMPKAAPGLTQDEMHEAMRQALPEFGSTAGWWMKTVQLDAEARGDVVRPPDRFAIGRFQSVGIAKRSRADQQAPALAQGQIAEITGITAAAATGPRPGRSRRRPDPPGRSRPGPEGLRARTAGRPDRSERLRG